METGDSEHEKHKTGATRPKRPAPISWRPPAAKRAAFEAMVAESGLTPNAFLTEAVFGRTRHRPAELRQNAQILGRCADIADSLRRIQTAEVVDQTVALEACLEALIEIRSALFLQMGRKP